MTRQKVTTIPGRRPRMRVRGEGRLCTNASNHNQRNTDIRGSGSVCRRNGPRGSQSVLQSLAAANAAEQQLDGHAARIRESDAEQPDVSAVDKCGTQREVGAVRAVQSSPSSIPCPTSIRTTRVNERTGSATQCLELPRPSPVRGAAHARRRPDVPFPTASARELGQDTWQIGPDVGATLLGKNFIAYAFVQQWFKVGGDGRDTNQMNGVFNFTYHLRKWVHDRQPAEPLGRLGGTRRQPSGLCDRTTDRKALQMRGHADLIPVAGSVLSGSSKRRWSEVEYSAASDADDSGADQENAVLTTSPSRYPSISIAERGDRLRDGRDTLCAIAVVAASTIARQRRTMSAAM